MDHKKELDNLHGQSLQKLQEYILLKKAEMQETDQEKFQSAQKEWQIAWAKLMDTLIVLENLEI